MLKATQTSGFGKQRTFSPEVSQFFNRITDPGSARKEIYAEFIDGLVTDGIWSKLDALWVFAAPDSTTALTNLVSSSFTATEGASTTFTADEGYTGNGGADGIVDSEFNPTTASSPNFVQDDATIFGWNLVNSAEGAGLWRDGASSVNYLAPRWTDGDAYYRVNHAAEQDASVSSDSTGSWIGTRRSSSDSELYRNGSSFHTNSASSTGSHNSTIEFIYNATYQICCGGIGSGLTDTEASDLHDRMNTLLTAIGTI